MDRKSPLKLVELMSCAITLGAPIVASGIVSADNVNEVQNVSYQKQNTKIAFDPNDALTKQALNKAHQSGAIKSVALVTLKDGKTSSVNMNNENGVYVATLQGNQKGTKYQFAITYQDDKTVKINNPYADNKLDTQFSVIGSKGVNPAVKTTNMTTVAPNGQMLEMKGTTRDGNSQTVTVNFHLYYLNKDTKTKVGDVVIPLQIKSQLFSHITEANGAVSADAVEAILAKSTVAAHCPNGYELIDPFSKGDNSDGNPNKIVPFNLVTNPTQMEANNTIECDYEVVPAPAQSSSSSSSSSSAQQVQAPAVSSSSASSAQPAPVVSSSSSSQAVTDNGHSSNQPANNPNDVNHGPVATSSSSSSSSSSASVSVVSSSKVSVSSSSVAAIPSKSSNSASDTQSYNQPAVVEKPIATSVSSSSSSSSNSDSKSSSSSSDKKQSESSVSSSSANAKSENNGSQSEQHNTAAVTQGATNSGETAENNGKGNDNFFGKSNGTTGKKQQAAVTKKDDNGNNGGNAGNTGATNDDNGNTNSNSASDSSSSSSSNSSVSSSSSSVAGNDNEKSMPQTGEMILRGLGILGVAALACVGGYYGFQAYKRKTK